MSQGLPSCELPAAGCPVCFHRIDRCSSADLDPEATPRAGDLIVCFYCAVILIFKDDMSLALPTRAELDAIDEKERLAAELVQMGILDICGLESDA